MFQVVVVSPARRAKAEAFDNVNVAINYAETFGEAASMEVVDERTGMLRATIERGKTERTLGSVRREVL